MTIPTTPDVILLPNQDQLPWDDGIPMETQRHKLQMDILIIPYYPGWLIGLMGMSEVICLLIRTDAKTLYIVN